MFKGSIERVKHIKTYCQDIEEHISRFGESFDTFQGDKMVFQAVSMCIFQIGELARGLSEEFIKDTREEIPWELIKGMRNRFAHNYEAMNKQRIWDTATKDIPILLRFCDRVIEEYKEG